MLLQKLETAIRFSPPVLLYTLEYSNWRGVESFAIGVETRLEWLGWGVGVGVSWSWGEGWGKPRGEIEKEKESSRISKERLMTHI